MNILRLDAKACGHVLCVCPFWRDTSLLSSDSQEVWVERDKKRIQRGSLGPLIILRQQKKRPTERTKKEQWRAGDGWR